MNASKTKPQDIRLLYIDLFCGAGGTTTGVSKAMYNGSRCASVVACVNHDQNAIASHAANHPATKHFTEDIRTFQLDPMLANLSSARKRYPSAKVVLWASLECTNFSKAKGGLPRDADSRTLADHLFRYIEAIDPGYMIPLMNDYLKAIGSDQYVDCIQSSMTENIVNIWPGFLTIHLLNFRFHYDKEQ